MSTDENTKEKIIEVAIECFGEYGYDGTSMRVIAEKSGVSKPAIYYYFPDKEHLFEGIFEYVMSKFSNMLINIQENNQDVISKLKEVILLRVKPLNQFNVKRFISRLLTNGGKHMPNLDHQSFFQTHEKILLSIIQQGIDDGTFKSDINKKYLLYAIIGSTNLFTRDHIMFNKPFINEKEVNTFLAQLIEGVAQGSI